MEPGQQLSLALEYGDLLRASMAGNLRSLEFEDAKGQVLHRLAADDRLHHGHQLCWAGLCACAWLCRAASQCNGKQSAATCEPHARRVLDAGMVPDCADKPGFSFGGVCRSAMHASRELEAEQRACRAQVVRGSQLRFGSQPAAYADEPWETVNYAACHDQEVLFDQVRCAAASAGRTG